MYITAAALIYLPSDLAKINFVGELLTHAHTHTHTQASDIGTGPLIKL